MSDEKKDGGIWGKLVLGVLTALFIGGTTPWWWDKVFEGKQPSTVASPTDSVSGSAKILPQERYEFKENDGPHAFVRVSDKVWKEVDAFDTEYNTFKEIGRDSDFITIYDASREMKIKIPIEGGQALITSRALQWVDRQYRYVAKK
jgi:hypothetical protein